MENEITITNINGRQIAVGGIGKAFYQNGYPIEISIIELKEKGIDVSFLNIADELYKHGWEEKTILRSFNTGDGYLCEISDIKRFIRIGSANGIPEYREPLPGGRTYIYGTTGWDEQRKMIHESLFGEPKEASSFFDSIIITN